jgi:hypothetical protein
MKLLVCGSRKIGKTDPATPIHLAGIDTQNATLQRKFVYDYLSQYHKLSTVTQVIGGDEGGAERLGQHWAKMNKIPSVTIRRLTFQPSIFWTFISFLTGKKRSSARKENIQDRNHRMLAETEPDLIIAFGAGESTETLLQEARDRGIEVIEVDVPVNHVHPTLD